MGSDQWGWVVWSRYNGTGKWYERDLPSFRSNDPEAFITEVVINVIKSDRHGAASFIELCFQVSFPARGQTVLGPPTFSPTPSRLSSSEPSVLTHKTPPTWRPLSTASITTSMFGRNLHLMNLSFGAVLPSATNGTSGGGPNVVHFASPLAYNTRLYFAGGRGRMYF